MADSQSNNHPDTKSSASEHIERRAEHAKYDTSSAEQSAHSAISGAADHVRSGVDKVSTAAKQAGKVGQAALESAKERAGDWTDEVRDYVREKPVQSVAIALAAGWLIGRLVHRR